MDRSAILGILRPRIKSFLQSIEDQVGREILFQPIANVTGVAADFFYDQVLQRPIIRLSPAADELDIAHEVMHLKLDIVEGYEVPVWRQNVDRTPEIEVAFGLIRSIIDDEVVHQRLTELELTLDGEIIRPQLFNDLCVNVPTLLKSGRPRNEDGMTHLDKYKRGRLRRAALLVLAERVRDMFGSNLSNLHLERLSDFIKTFRQYRKHEVLVADPVLQQLREDNPTTITGHSAALRQWLKLEGLDAHVGLSRYTPSDTGFILKFPHD